MSSNIKAVESLKEKDEKLVWHAFRKSNVPSMIVKKTEGSWVTDIDGNQYLDAMAGLWCVNVGYGRKELAQAAATQLETASYYPLTQSHPPAILLAEKLNEWLDDEYVIFFSNSGSEANETAFKIALQYHQQRGKTSKTKFISRYRAYHGNTLGALGATGQGQRKYKYEALTSNFIHVAPPDDYRHTEEENMRFADDIDRAMTWEMSETIAGVIMEPIITGGGVLFPPSDYLARVQEICEKHDALFIVDEVISGFGRTGKPFGFMNYNVKPDIVTMAKGITSGYVPLSATAVKKEIYEAFKGNEEYDYFRHVNTYGGSPVACAVALKNLEIMERENLVSRSELLGMNLLNSLQILKEHPFVGDIRGKGLLVGIELVKDKGSKEPLEVEKVTSILAECKKNGLIIGKNGDTVAGFNNVLTLSPPLTITEDEIRIISSTLFNVLINIK